jgi:hypothetical protein
MYHYWGWRKRQTLRKLKRVGKQYGLSLDEYSDDQIVEGFKQLK